MPGGVIQLAPADLDVPSYMAQARARAAEHFPPDAIESKPMSVAVHVRGMEPERAVQVLEGVRDEWTSLSEGDPALVVHPFDGGLEFKVEGRNKGDAVRSILDEEPGDTPAAYLGDDLTDEDAFASLAERGLPVLVRNEYRPTRGRLWLRPPAELLEFLRRWLTVDQSR